MDEAAAIGVLQMHFTGGEPMARRDLHTLVRRAAGAPDVHQPDHQRRDADRPRHGGLMDAGIDHIQLSFQDIEPAENDRVGGYRGRVRQEARGRGAHHAKPACR